MHASVQADVLDVIVRSVGKRYSRGVVVFWVCVQVIGIGVLGVGGGCRVLFSSRG